MTPTVRTRVEAPVMEVFASIQGEGRYVGEPQAFLRLRGCPLRCRWCDTPGSWSPAGPPARISPAPEAGARPRGPERATPFQAVCWIAAVEPAGPRTVSVTGGEPLLWPEFLLGLPAVAGPRRLHLETAGGHPDELRRVVDVFDHVSLDLKLPADLGAPEPIAGERLPEDEGSWREARRASLALVQGRDAAAKLVVCGDHRAEDFRPLIDDAAELAGDVPLFVQPVTAVGGVPAAPAELVVEVAELARSAGLEVRVVPQVHRRLRLP
jgi:organic radical activating enzyme